MVTSGRLPTIECSFCRSLCRPSPLEAKCSRITAIQRLEPSPPQQRFPLMPRQAAILEIGARPFAAMIEETDVVVRCFDRPDLAGDELIELGEVRDQTGRQCKIQGSSPDL